MSENIDVTSSVSQTQTASSDLNNSGSDYSQSIPDNNSNQAVSNDSSISGEADYNAAETVNDNSIVSDNSTPAAPDSQIQNNDENIPEALQNAVKNIQDYYTKVNEEERTFLHNQLAKYDSEHYLGNPEFKNLYSAAYEALGMNLDTDKFVSLLDKYVESRINAYDKIRNLNKENQEMTDKLQFESGQSKKAEKKLRMQDIPPEELEKYIAKYI